MELTDAVKTLVHEAATQLKGSARRVFMAKTVRELGTGGQRRAERELGWSRMTIRKGMHELESGIACVDAFALRGRKNTCPTYWRTCRRSWTARVKRTRSSAPSGCTPA
jgi:hypothetical protein